MRIVQIPDVLHEYLLQVIEKYAAQGIHPEEGMAIARLWDAVSKQATHIDAAEIKKMAVATSPNGQSPIDTPREREDPGWTLPRAPGDP